jgi:predicted lysophospholipase L1 biosynthesis ABC-type transport system permease subunit
MRRRAAVKVWQAFLGVQAMVLLIALVMPITPLKTGGRANAAALFFENPGYLHEALVWYLAGNVMVALIAVIAVIAVRRSNRNKPAE